jgi:chromosomal replication initiation ATPase DnaA
MRQNNVVVNDILILAEERIHCLTGLKVELFANEIASEQEILPAHKQAINLLATACELWGISRQQIKQKNRVQPLPTFRFIASLLLRINFDKSVSDSFIAVQLGYNEHTSVLHGVQTAQTFLKNNDEYFLRYYNKVKHLFNF